jgi:hypothetical protein
VVLGIELRLAYGRQMLYHSSNTPSPLIYISLSYFFLALLGFELRALSLLYHMSHIPCAISLF